MVDNLESTTYEIALHIINICLHMIHIFQTFNRVKWNHISEGWFDSLNFVQ